MYQNPDSIPRGRPRLAAVLQASGAFLTADDVARVLGVERPDAARVLARWNAQGWIRRVKRGLYVPVPIDTQTGEQVLEDPWVLVPRLFDEAYIGGWSAAEHWGLTEQLFRSIYVFTTQTVRKKETNIQSIPFVLKHVPASALFGLKPVWRGTAKVMVSSPARTIIDMLAEPSVGGGMRHVAECLDAFLKMENANPEELITFGDQLGSGVVFKRLGFLLEGRPPYAAVVEACQSRITTGLSKLDPALLCPRVVKRWRLRVPDAWKDKP